MQNYKIILDEKKLEEFIDFLPVCNEHEQYYIALLARKKYVPELKEFKSDKAQLKRFTSQKNRIIEKIRQLECAIGTYKKDDVVLPNEALALYITVNPRDLKRAGLNLMVTLAQLTRDGKDRYNPHQEALSEIQKSCSRKIYYDIDIDETDMEKLEDTMQKIKSFVNEDSLHFLKTKGGVHCLVELEKIEKQYNKSWYKNITSLPKIDICGDNLIPVAGCIQGGFVPYFI